MTTELYWVDALYRTADKCTVTAETVPHDQLRAFAASARSLDRRLSQIEGEGWDPFRRKARRAAWDALNVPVRLSQPGLHLLAAANELEHLASAMKQRSNPSLVLEAIELARLLAVLGGLDDDPLGDRCREILLTGNPQASAVLVREVRWREMVRREFTRRGCATAVLTAPEVRGLHPIETLVVVGQARFYEHSVFDAPRAENVCIVRYSWLRDITEIDTFLPVPGAQQRPIRGFTDSSQTEEDYVSPLIDWSAINLAGVERAEGIQDRDRDTDRVRSRLFLLAGAYGVYLDIEAGPAVLTIDLEGDGEARVRRHPARELSPGDFVLLRRERGEVDFIEDVANQLLGQEAPQLRATQARWKERLRERAAQAGISQVTRDLRGLGTQVQNVRYWLSPSNIRTQRVEDFHILMQYLDLGSEADLIWSQMERIDDAHRLAGHRIRSQLIERVLDADLSHLEHDGWMDFELADDEAGALTVFRVEAESPDELLVPRSHLRAPFVVERDKWLG